MSDEHDSERPAVDEETATILALAIQEAFGEEQETAFAHSRTGFDSGLDRFAEIVKQEGLIIGVRHPLPRSEERAESVIQRHAKTVVAALARRSGNSVLFDTDFEFESLWEEWKYQVQKEPLRCFDQSRDFIYDECEKRVYSLPVEHRKVLWLFVSRQSNRIFSRSETDFKEGFPDDYEEELVEEIYTRVHDIADAEPLECDPDEMNEEEPEWPAHLFAFWQEEHEAVGELIDAVRKLLARHNITAREVSQLGIVLHILERLPLTTAHAGISLTIPDMRSCPDQTAYRLLVTGDTFKLIEATFEAGTDREIAQRTMAIRPHQREGDVDWTDNVSFAIEFEDLASKPDIPFAVEVFEGCHIDWSDTQLGSRYWNELPSWEEFHWY